MKIGLTGGMACGKSTVAASLRQRGYYVLSTDACVRELLAEDPGVIGEVLAAFGPGVVSEIGGIDRAALAAIVFGDRGRLEQLESILHPRVRNWWQGTAEADPARRWVIEIPLLFEKNLESSFDLTVSVIADTETQRRRLRARGLTAEDIQGRLDRQLPLFEKSRRADCVLLNSGSLVFLEEQLDLLEERLTSR